MLANFPLQRPSVQLTQKKWLFILQKKQLYEIDRRSLKPFKKNPQLQFADSRAYVKYNCNTTITDKALILK